MPWTASDAEKHTHLASTPHLQRLWANAANSALNEHGDDGRAVRTGNAAVRKAIINGPLTVKKKGRK